MKKILLTALVVTSMGSVYAEGNHNGGHDAGAHWMSPKEASEKPNPIKADATSIKRGKELYASTCSSCHGKDAKGDGPIAASLNPKPANLVAMSGMHPDGDFAWKIANGRGAMPAWKSILNEKQIWELVNYIQTLNPNGKLMDMSKMDHSNMSAEDMKKMMSNMGHSDSDGHHEAPKKKIKSGHDDAETGHSH